jgi:hypothetical protein
MFGETDLILYRQSDRASRVGRSNRSPTTGQPNSGYVPTQRRQYDRPQWMLLAAPPGRGENGRVGRSPAIGRTTAPARSTQRRPGHQADAGTGLGQCGNRAEVVGKAVRPWLEADPFAGADGLRYSARDVTVPWSARARTTRSRRGSIAFSYPVVPKNKARIRVQRSAAHSEDDIRNAVAAFIKVRDEPAQR